MFTNTTIHSNAEMFALHDFLPKEEFPNLRSSPIFTISRSLEHAGKISRKQFRSVLYEKSRVDREQLRTVENHWSIL